MDCILFTLVAMICGIIIPFVHENSRKLKIFSLIGSLTLVVLAVKIVLLSFNSQYIEYNIVLDKMINLIFPIHIGYVDSVLILLTTIIHVILVFGSQKRGIKRSSLSASFFAVIGISLAIVSRGIVGFFIANEFLSILLYYVMPIRSNSLVKKIQAVIIATSGLMLFAVYATLTKAYEINNDISLTISSLKSIIGINTPHLFMSEFIFWVGIVYVLSRTVIFPASLWQSKFTSSIGRSSLALHITLPAIAAYCWFANFVIEVQPLVAKNYQGILLIIFCFGAIYNIFISLGQRKLERDAIFFSSVLLSFVFGNVLLLTEEGQSSGLTGIVFIALLNCYVSIIISALDRVFGSTLLPLCERSSKYSSHFLTGIIIVYLMVMGIPGGIGFTFLYSSLVSGVKSSNLIGLMMLIVWLTIMSVMIQKVKVLVLNYAASAKNVLIKFNYLELTIISILIIAFIFGGVLPKYIFLQGTAL